MLENVKWVDQEVLVHLKLWQRSHRSRSWMIQTKTVMLSQWCVHWLCGRSQCRRYFCINPTIVARFICVIRYMQQSDGAETPRPSPKAKMQRIRASPFHKGSDEPDSSEENQPPAAVAQRPARARAGKKAYVIDESDDEQEDVSDDDYNDDDDSDDDFA